MCRSFAFFSLCLCLLCGAPATAVDGFATGDRYAVIAGVQDYRHLPPLEFARTDARSLAAQFESLGYTVILLENYQADPEHILGTLNEIGVQMDASYGRENGTLVFAFSGHGFQQDGQNFLATGHSRDNNPRRGALSIQRIKRVLQHSGIARKMMFIDACRNDPTKSTVDPQRRFLKDTSTDGLAIMYSTGAGELSWEDSELSQGVFSYYLAEGLAGAAATDSVLSFNGLFSYVSAKVSQHVFKRFDRRQIPYTAGERNGDFFIGRVKKRRPSWNWRRALTVAGVVALGAAIASAGSTDSSSESESTVTVVIPTP